jgi:HK97 family phage prohead protease
MGRNNLERRYVNAKIELRGTDAEPVVSGYAARFNELSEELWGFKEKIAPGAFSEAIRGADIRALFNHDPSQIVARTKNNTLKVWEDEYGLRYEFTPNMKTTAGRDLVEHLRRGDIDQSSFAFSMEGGVEEWDDSGDMPVRILKKIGRLYDVSPVTYPAYPSTSVGLRSAEEIYKAYMKTKKEADIMPFTSGYVTGTTSDPAHYKFLEERGVSPQDVSREKAPEGEAWEAPTLSDFTSTPWDELSDAEKRRIAGHYAWAAMMPPETFGDLKLPHHRPSDGAVVWRGVANAAARLSQTDIPDADIPKVQAHLGSHYRQFDRIPPWEEESKRKIMIAKRKLELYRIKEV